jgi:thiol-disulfide isomerase/thioredoxin
MKLQIKQLSALFLLVFFTLFLSILIYILGRQLYVFRITDLFIINRNIYPLILVILHFLVGFLLVNRIKFFDDVNNIFLISSFFFIYIIIPLIIKLLLNNIEFYPFIKEITLIIGFTIGLLFRNIKKKSLITIPLGIIGLFLLFTKNIALPFSEQAHNYGNLTGKSKNFIKVNILKLVDSNGKKVYINTANNPKIIVIDFWNNHCGICFKKFPIIKSLQREYYDNHLISVIAINVFSDTEEIVKSKELLKQTNNSDLITYYMSEDDAKIFNLEWYPKTIIVKNNEIIFEGHIEILKLLKNMYLK